MSIAQLQEVSEAIDVFLTKARRKPRTLANFRRLMRSGERKLIPRVREWMAWSRMKMKAGLSGMKGRTATARTKSITDWDEIMEKGVVFLKPTILELVAEGGKAVVERRVIKQERFDPIGIAAVEWATEHAAELVKEITEETMEGISTYIATGIDAGKSVPAIARELRPLVGLREDQITAVANYHEKLILERPEYTAVRQRKMAEVYARRLHRNRAALIARTETREALWEGVFEGYGQMGIKNVEGVSGPGACDWCIDNIDGKVYTIAEARALDAHPACECSWVMGPRRPETADVYAKEISDQAIRFEPHITESMKEIASRTGTSLAKLDFRLKTKASIGRKLSSMVRENPLLSFRQAAKGIKDAVRYTVLAPTKKFSVAVAKMNRQLAAKGLRLKKVSNYYGSKGAYQGINAKYYDPKSKMTFEVQFHTKQSLAIADKNHLLYEKARISTNAKKVTELNDQMIRNWDKFEMPKGAPGLFSGPID